jgi:hypothetical protein
MRSFAITPPVPDARLRERNEVATMTHDMKKRIRFRPSIGVQKLEDRLVLSSIPIASATPPIVVLTPSVTPAPAAAPVGTKAITKSLRNALAAEYRDARTDLRTVLDAAIKQLYTTGAKPTAQQKAAYDAEADGAVDAAALRMSAQASILPGSTSLVPAIENQLLGGLTNRLAAITQNPRATVSAQALRSAVNQAATSASTHALAKVQNFVDTAPLSKLSVTSTGASLPVQAFMADQVVSQLEHNLGQFEQTFPSAANVIMQSNTTSAVPATTTGTTSTGSTTTTGTSATTGLTTGTTTTPLSVPTLAQFLLNQGNGQAANALETIGFVLGSELALFPGSSSVVSQLGGISASTGTSSAVTGVPAQLANLQTATIQPATTTLNTGLTNLVTPVTTFLESTSPANLALSSGNFSNAFASGTATAADNATFSIGSLSSAFASSTANAFSSSTSSTNFGIGFSSLANLTETSGLFPPGSSLFTTTTAPGGGSLVSGTTIAPGMTSLPVTGTNTSTESLTTVGTTSPGQTSTVTSGSL